ncbi:MAG: Glycosyltransferase [Candidatus Woesebacteria bacterium GW2011_GWC1_38_13]|uniref:Glycosyltransferase n=3 Tax=Candidatus Woeseibacteriota TaxID=1752722 RepID=A0A0G0KZK1_9BACT|nr:MAG: Glycosyltransferase [Candidatus Woesebacteria bacterium GW2011_GWD1_38_10]KKQ56829.1 MAG: Glycosyltransferase [Candidatus Woesebacteria bacterium GW2011_GWC1_38_13]KKQ84157.1 MAG: Glycosyltransferase [Candidatus Woesebacteria bacterium GW2011_GWA1_38_8]
MDRYPHILIFALSAMGKGLSGGDRIYIELSRLWSKQFSVTICTTSDGVKMIKTQNLIGNYLEVNQIGNKNLPSNFLLKYLYKIYLGIRLGFSLNINHKSSIINHLLYSSSDFWMDVFPAVILKIRYPKLKWIATWYQTAPNPIRGYREMKKRGTKELKNQRNNNYNLSAFFYWLSQLPIKPLISVLADFVIVNNEDERKRFPEMEKKGKVIVLLGAVRLNEIKKFLSANYKLLFTKKFDAVFQGRFHPQKGVVELIDIWRKVVDRIPNAKLAMIGDGPLMKDVRIKIQDLRLEKNVELFGYVFDGPEKYKIFAQSKIVVHPAFYDSGGMASAEAMAFGLPAVGFDLKSYVSYYPKGMLKVDKGNLNAFGKTVIRLLCDDQLRKKYGEEAKLMIIKDWSWDKRAKEVLNKIS